MVVDTGTRKAELLGQIVAAAQAGDLDRVAALQRESSALIKVVEEEAANATVAERNVAREALAQALGTRESQTAIRQALQAEWEVNVKRTRDTGALDDGKGAVMASKLYDAVMPLIVEHCEGAASIKAVKVTFAEGKFTVTTSATGGTRAPGGGGTTGKGWVKNGQTYKLGDIFEANKAILIQYGGREVTGEAALQEVKGDNTKENSVKVKVARKAGFTLNG